MAPFVFVLGIAQDGGHPQPGCTRACCRELAPGEGHLPASLAIVDPDAGKRWIVDATPAFPAQLARLGEVAPGPLDGILLTHAHIGHYTGLMYLGREVMGTVGLPLLVQPRMGEFLARNGPWKQLVDIGNVVLQVGTRWTLTERVTVDAIPVPHRDEYSETVAFVIRGPTHSVLWLPDIDRWEAWSHRLQDVLATVDAAWIDGTFWADGELSRDMAEVPHPRIAATIERLAALPAVERAKVRFVHLNHTNPAYKVDSREAELIRINGVAVATEGERFDL
jgi:pyrroloquinoline quinone biosynthesis protein B